MGSRLAWGKRLNAFLPGRHENLDLGEINLLFSMPQMASITASATLCPFSLAHCLPWRTEGSRRYLDRCQDRGKHRPGFLPEKPLRRGRPVRTCEEKIVHRGQARTLSGMVEPSQLVIS
jgi:hypothetical protein